MAQRTYLVVPAQSRWLVKAAGRTAAIGGFRRRAAAIALARRLAFMNGGGRVVVQLCDGRRSDERRDWPAAG